MGISDSQRMDNKRDYTSDGPEIKWNKISHMPSEKMKKWKSLRLDGITAEMDEVLEDFGIKEIMQVANANMYDRRHWRIQATQAMPPINSKLNLFTYSMQLN
jgi:hypothetical protein